MALADALRPIIADLAKTYTLGDAPVTARIGARWRDNAIDLAPCLVFVRSEEDEVGEFNNFGLNPPQVGCRRVSCLVYVYGLPPASFDDLDSGYGDDAAPAEALLTALQASVHRIAYGYSAIGHTTWSNQDGSVNTYGASCVTGLSIDIPVNDVVLPEACVEAISLTTSNT